MLNRLRPSLAVALLALAALAPIEEGCAKTSAPPPAPPSPAVQATEDAACVDFEQYVLGITDPKVIATDCGIAETLINQIVVPLLDAKKKRMARLDAGPGL